MSAIKISEQIAFLRKQNGLTQEELANALGVTNQAVSKWESAQNCPDIQLLPTIAELFHVSIDELFGYAPAAASVNCISTLRNKIDSLSKTDAYAFTFRMAAALHTILFSREMTAGSNADPGWNTDDAIKHAGNAEWGYSCWSVPEITTTMRQGAVFFSNNRNLILMNEDIRHIVSIIKPFSDAKNLKIAAALYQLTVQSEDAYATIAQISEKSGLPEEKIGGALTCALAPFIYEKADGEGAFRFEGMYMNLLPILSLLDFK